MPDQLEIIQELARRGKLPDAYKPFYDEAVKRGLVKSQEQPNTTTVPKNVQGKPNWEYGSILPIARNPDTGAMRFMTPSEFMGGAVGDVVDTAKGVASSVASAFTAPGRAFSGQLPTQAVDPSTGEVHASPQAISEAGNFATTFSPGAPATFPAEGTIASSMGKTEALPSTENVLKTSAEAKASGAAKMEAAKGSGIEFKPQAASESMADLNQKLFAAGYDPRVPIFGNAKAALGRLQEIMGVGEIPGEWKTVIDNLRKAGKNDAADKIMESFGGNKASFRDIHSASQTLKAVRSSQNPQERMFGQMMKDALDEHVFNLNEKDVATPGNMSAEEAAKNFKEGLKEYARGSLADDIDAIANNIDLRSHQFSRSGYDNATLTEFRQLARNQKRLRLFPKEMQDKIKSLANGGSFAQKVARQIGKFAVRGVHTGVGDAVIGHFLHGVIPGGPIGVMMVGEAGRQIANAMGRQSIEDLRKMALSGEGDAGKLKQFITPERYQQLVKSRARQNDVIRWLRSSGKAKTEASRALALTVLKASGSKPSPALIDQVASQLNGLGGQSDNQPQ